MGHHTKNAERRGEVRIPQVASVTIEQNQPARIAPEVRENLKKASAYRLDG